MKNKKARIILLSLASALIIIVSLVVGSMLSSTVNNESTTSAESRQGGFMGINPASFTAGTTTYAEQFSNDPVLAQLMAQHNGKAVGDVITAADITATTRLEFMSKNISDISGIEAFVNIDYLELTYNNISVIPPGLAQLTNLRFLYLGGNQISVIPLELCNMNSLLQLYLHSNAITVVPNEIANLNKLQLLDVSNNQLQAIPPIIGTMTTLTNFKFMSNNITVLPPEFGNLINLTSFHFNKNKISVLPDIFQNMTKITTITGNDNLIQVIPPSLYSLLSNPSTPYFDFKRNNIIDLPSNIYNLTLNAGQFDFQTNTRPVTQAGYVDETFTFAALPIESQIQDYVPALFFAYALVMPDGSETALNSSQYNLANGQFAITDTSLLQQEGNYILKPTVNYNSWKFERTFTLTTPVPSSSLPPDDSSEAPNSGTAPIPSSSEAPSSAPPPIPGPSSGTTPISSSAPAGTSSATSSSLSSSQPSSAGSSSNQSTSRASSSSIVSSAGTPASASSATSSFSSSPAPSESTATSMPSNQEKRESLRADLIDQGVPTFQFGNTRVPFTGGGERFVWSLLSLLIMIASAVLAALVLIKMLINKRKGEDITNDLFKIIAAAIGAVSLISFFIMYNLRSLMVIADSKTILFALLLAAEIILLVWKNIMKKIHSK